MKLLKLKLLAVAVSMSAAGSAFASIADGSTGNGELFLSAANTYAGGVTAFEGGSICYNIPYYKNYPPDQSIAAWQYVDYLTGLYFKRFGIVLDREFFGTLTATLIPPCLAIATGILEAILAIQQGVKCVSLGYAEQGDRVQDIAGIRVIGEMAKKFIRNLGYKDVQINTVFHQYMAAFPETQKRAEELIYNSAMTAAFSRATRVIVKTPVEATDEIAERIREVLRFVEPERLWIAPSCGFGRRRTTDIAVGKLSRMVEAAKRF